MTFNVQIIPMDGRCVTFNVHCRMRGFPYSSTTESEVVALSSLYILLFCTQVDVLPPTDPSKCKAYGPGLESALVGRQADFTVETKGAGAGGLSLAIEGPSEAKLTCNDHGDGTCSVKYKPTEPGDYEIHIKLADEHIPGSPFKAKVCIIE